MRRNLGDTMSKLVLIAGLLHYAITAVVVRLHFSSSTFPREAHLLAIVSYVGLAAFTYLMLRDRHAAAGLLAALGLFVASMGLFFWTVATTRSRRPRIAFDPWPPGFVTQTGPYRYIQHPFHASYLLFWLGCAVATLHPVSLAFLVVFSAIFLVVAIREERSFEGTPFAAEYGNYRRTAGLLWPRFGAEDGG